MSSSAAFFIQNVSIFQHKAKSHLTFEITNIYLYIFNTV